MKSVKITTLLMMGVLGVSAWAGQPAITSVSPNSGPLSGGQAVRIRGTDFAASGTTVTIGGAAATVITQTTAYVDVTTPLGTTAGAADVVVTNSNGASTGGTGAYTYINRNNTLQVRISASIARRVFIRWGAGSVDSLGVDHGVDPNRFTPYDWTVVDSAIPGQQLELATSYRSDDVTNNRTIVINNAGSSNVDISATATAPSAFSLLGVAAGSPGNNEVRISGALGTGALAPLSGTAATLTTAFAPGNLSAVFNFETPASISGGVTYATPYSFSVTLTAVGN